LRASLKDSTTTAIGEISSRTVRCRNRDHQDVAMDSAPQQAQADAEVSSSMEVESSQNIWRTESRHHLQVQPNVYEERLSIRTSVPCRTSGNYG
jgi:hypothetical protein